MNFLPYGQLSAAQRYGLIVCFSLLLMSMSYAPRYWMSVETLSAAKKDYLQHKKLLRKKPQKPAAKKEVAPAFSLPKLIGIVQKNQAKTAVFLTENQMLLSLKVGDTLPGSTPSIEAIGPMQVTWKDQRTHETYQQKMQSLSLPQKEP